MEWGSGFESSRSPLPNDPPRFPHLFWKVRENENGGMKETRMKSELFTSCLGEKIIFGMETQRQAAAPKSRTSPCEVRDFCCPRLCVKWDSGALGSTEGDVPAPSTIFREPSGKIPQSEARCFGPLILKRATNGLCWRPFCHTFLSRIAMYSFPGRGTRKLPEKIPRSVTVISQVSMTSTRQETPSSLWKLRKLGRPKP